MKINRMAEEKLAPNWVFDDNKQINEYFEKETIDTEEINRLASLSCNISEDDIVVEKDRIEVMASSNKPYHCNSKWPNNVKSELREYAVVCGMDMTKFRTLDTASLTSEMTTIKQQASNSRNIKTASVNQLILSDPFKLDDKIAGSHEKTKWQPEIQLAAKLGDKPLMNGIVPIRGGENYFENSESKTAINQNSITNPNAIGKLADSQTEDTGTRLKRENQEKEASKKTKHANWQQEKIADMTGKDIIPNRRVFPTECMNAQPGIKGEVFDFSKLPDKTEGEKIKEANENRKQAIQGNKKEKYQFVTEKAEVRSISENFADELKKHLK